MKKHKIRILIVEDHDLVSKGVVQTLKESELQFNITTASNGDRAYDYLKQNLFDVILLDLMLQPELPQSQIIDGDDLIIQMRKLTPSPKIIVISKIKSLEMLDYIINGLGADGYILKSRKSLQEIIPAIETVLSRGYHFSDKIMGILKYNESLLDIDSIDRVILRSLADGLRQKDIIFELQKRETIMTLSAIEKRIKKLCLRFGASTSIELIALAIKQEII